ncbi:UNVERIFIED_CONTAM: hypothetical protein FKN15_002988 [Acipenser sinensis]
MCDCSFEREHGELQGYSTVHREHGELQGYSTVHREHGELQGYSTVHREHGELQGYSTVHREHGELQGYSTVHREHGELQGYSTVHREHGSMVKQSKCQYEAGFALQMFLLPARIPHSPQRQAGTVGLVIERQRLQSETDGLRYYVDNSTAVLFERWFYCENLGVQLAPIISEYYVDNSTAVLFERWFYCENLGVQLAPIISDTHVMTPFCFKEWIDKHRQELSRRPCLDMFGVQFETETVLYGDGESEGCKPFADIWIWQLEGTSQVMLCEESVTLSAGDSYLIPGQNKYQWKRSEGCIALYVVQDPERKRPHS